MTYKRSEIAVLLNISERTLRRWIKAARVPVLRYSRLTKKDIETIDKHLQSNILSYIR